MKDELVRKIQHVLDRPITNEMQVVYLLVEMRKLMDREAYKDQVLRMFCNWIVHTSLENRAEGSTLILREFDDLMTRIFERKERLPHFEHVSFRAFREALMRCFESFGLSAKFIKDIDHWEKLFNLYSSIVGDCPIVFRASKMKLKYINRVDLRGVGYGPVIKQWPILQWRLTLNDGKTMNWGFHLG
jgi:hypothetical protein